MKYINFCSGSKGNCTYIESKQTKLIIDCGSTKRYLSQSLHNYDIQLDSVDALLITHDHGDHIAQLRLFDSIEKCISPVPLNRESINPMPYQSFMIKDIEVTALVLSHDSGLTYGYVLKSEGVKLVYITDTGYLKDNNLDYISNADIYLIESNHNVDKLMQSSRPHMTKMRILSDTGHLSNEDSAKILKRVIGPKTKEIVLAHLSEEANSESLALKAFSQVIDTHEIHIHCAKQRSETRGGFLNEEYTNETLNIRFAHLK